MEDSCNNYDVNFVITRVQDESLRWLAANGKKDAVDKIIHKVAKWNKLSYEDLKKLVDKRMAVIEQETNDVDVKKPTADDTIPRELIVEKYSIITILKNRNILFISMVMWFTW